ncbi:hypothetical protein [Acidovorax sp.]|uniref:hypothetical protein n=1 Tax=Acidovorax sp. TaxID=1872122 RepID=UPI0026047044|nr:hypothetical protein [Acidovorax sp.]HQS63387.1 hypothetical protein [Acidovorax defluvii]HQT19173.1 hypothetical protein [Acidovorax defluvii]
MYIHRSFHPPGCVRRQESVVTRRRDHPVVGPCDGKMLPFPPRLLANSYPEINSLKTIPLLLDGETCMTEFAVIYQYLVALSSPLSLNLKPVESDFSAYLNYWHFGD